MSASRPRIVVATSFPVHPPRGGGQARVAGLYGALARQGVDVDIVALVASNERARTFTPAPGVREHQVPKSAAHSAAEWTLEQRAGVPVGDLALALHHDLTPAYGRTLAALADGAAAAVASHPFAHPALATLPSPRIYEAQDVEADLKALTYEQSPDAPELVAQVRELEAACCAESDHITVCADADGRRLDALYGVGVDKLATVPNGADPTLVHYTELATRRARKGALGLGQEQLAVYLGSWHGPNLAVVDELLAHAGALTHARIIVVGGASLPFAHDEFPDNFDMCGVVDDAFLRSLLSVADAALNPMRWGSGTNLKMFEYALAGVPLISTAFGARGIGFEPGVHYLDTDVDDLPAILTALRSEPFMTTADRVETARRHVLEHFSWDRIAASWRAHPAMAELLGEVVHA